MSALASASFPDAALGAGSRIGRYFGVVSVIPSALFVLFLYALIASDAWNGKPDLRGSADALGSISLGEASALLVVTLAFALVLHPLQFALTQAMEGYWGWGMLSRTLAIELTIRHRRRYANADEEWGRHLATLGDDVEDWADNERIREFVPALLGRQSMERVRDVYPDDPDRFMPTRLGNMLRRYEDRSGKPYGLSALTIHPHLVIAADTSHVAVLNDAREQVDLAIRLSALSALAAIIASAFLMTDGLWLLMALIPYGGAYLCYRGAVTAAANWGAALAAIIDLDRFRLYEDLHLVLPDDTDEERADNAYLTPLLRDREPWTLRYCHSPTTAEEPES